MAEIFGFCPGINQKWASPEHNRYRLTSDSATTSLMTEFKIYSLM